MRGPLRLPLGLVAGAVLLVAAAAVLSGWLLLPVVPLALVLMQGARRARDASGAGARRVLWAVALGLPVSGLLGALGAPAPAGLAAAALLVAADGLWTLRAGCEPPPVLPGLGPSLGLRGRLGLAVDELALGLAPRRPRGGAGPRAVAPAEAAEPERRPGALVPPAVEKVSRVPLLRDGTRRVEALRFESEYEPTDPGIRAAWGDVPGNRSARVQLYRDAVRPRPVLIAVHDLGGGHPAVDLHRNGLARLSEVLDLDLALLVLPLHGERAEEVGPGEGWFDGSPAWSAAALGQSVHELQRLADWLRRQGAPAVGLHGRGLGGLVSALGAGLPLGLASVVLREPVVSFPELWRRVSGVSDAGVVAELRQRLVGFDPLSRGLAVPRDAALITAARADRLAPAEAAQALAAHWGVALFGTAGGHWLPLGGRDLEAKLVDHLQRGLTAAEASPAQVLTRFRRA